MRRYTRLLIWPMVCLLFAATARGEGKITDKLSQLPDDWQTILLGEAISYDTPGDSIGIPNDFDGTSYLKEAAEDYVLVQITDASTLQLKRLADKKGNEMYVGIYTVYGPAGESDVRFFDAEMKPLPAKNFIKMPELKNFFKIEKGCKTSLKEIEKMLPFNTIEAKVSPDNDDLVFTLTCEDYVSVDDYNILKLFLQPAVYRWQKGKYTLMYN